MRVKKMLDVLSGVLRC